MGSMEMKSAHVYSGPSWVAKIIASIVCLASVCLIGTLLVFTWMLFGTNVDFPPTWYWALTVLLTAADVAAICYITLKTVQVLIRKTAPWRVLGVTAVILTLLGAAHVITAYAYANIPQWDFQDDLFDDLSRPHAGSISSDCKEAPTQSPGVGSRVSSSPAPGAEQPMSYEEVQRIAW